MTVIASISGIRGTIGGKAGEGLTPVDIVRYTAAYALQRRRRFSDKERICIVVGRDARISGDMVMRLVTGTLSACGADVIDAGKATTPTTEMAVVISGADGGIILTASHNPKEWNALKLLDEKGEFLSDADGKEIMEIASAADFDFAPVTSIGSIAKRDFTREHIDAVLNYPLVDCEAVRKARFKVVLDAINSVGAIAMPPLLEALGVECITINGTADGNFAHNPEPLPENLRQLSEAVKANGASLGISVDPDVDRLAFVCEDGTPFGEEYTLVAVADYYLGLKPGPTVSNLSSSRALRDVSEAHGCTYRFSKVGEKNVSTLMQETGAVIGGEGNGGVIVPDFHYGRDALIGTALFLSHLAKKGCTASALRDTYPPYFISKNKIELGDTSAADPVIDAVRAEFSDRKCDNSDGLRVDFEEEREWFVLRKSNTEPIIRIYAEARDEAAAEALAGRVIAIVNRKLGR